MYEYIYIYVIYKHYDDYDDDDDCYLDIVV